MIKQIKTLLLGVIAVFLFVIPVSVSAQSTTTLDISNVWFDNNADQLRPNSVTVNIFADGVLVKKQDISIANQNQGNPSQWSMNQIKLDALNADGSEINYTFTVDPVTNYSTKIRPSKDVEQVTSGGGRSGRAQTGGTVDTVTTYQLLIFNTEAVQPTPTPEPSSSSASTSTSDSSTESSTQPSTTDSTDKTTSEPLNDTKSDKNNSNDKKQAQPTSNSSSAQGKPNSSQHGKKMQVYLSLANNLLFCSLFLD
ncbi:hypothetical protein HMPREF9318_01727 [Streptococcus urinalis FB127-CNA-2]|uniref:CNA-B domain-containing protein n=1 Tax=Streptococcus urinalis 2285-97 TaxID=764291 RepID=G5KEB9_9STRE|nr:Cna B-type domain-containing protein [Streptococcus urinalis]EHJ56241.1 hypothetical protein STRUR_2057 [Streptococcus urinalis 2285-97]EKS18228.1 hypothetical protein HMPREF9318_01727 [Streptococcus urinalis FB127-CNA-2]VEF32897.1 Uncharacterised protein [Streptococcus urinalis]